MNDQTLHPDPSRAHEYPAWVAEQEGRRIIGPIPTHEQLVEMGLAMSEEQHRKWVERMKGRQ